MNNDVKEIIKLKNFKCQQCSNCCRVDPGIVLLTDQDIQNAHTHLKMSEGQFITDCCREVYRTDGVYLSLKEKSNYDCIFWSHGCIIYEARPLQCRTFPFWPSVVELNGAWQAEKERCPGLDQEGDLTYQQKYDYYLAEKNAKYRKIRDL